MAHQKRDYRDLEAREIRPKTPPCMITITTPDGISFKIDSRNVIITTNGDGLFVSAALEDAKVPHYRADILRKNIAAHTHEETPQRRSYGR